MPGLDSMLREATGMPVAVADEPDTCAVRGLGALIEGRVLPVPAFQPQPAA
jgi:rod shape-determining protein MreB